MNSRTKRAVSMLLAWLLVLSVVSPQLWSSSTASADASTTDALVQRFSMGHPGGSQSGMDDWIIVLPNSQYTEAQGYGIITDEIPSSRDRNNPEFTPLENQFLMGVKAFRTNVPNGQYAITVYSGDLIGSGTVNMNIAVDGESKGRVSSKGTVGTHTFSHTVTNGYLQLDFSGHLYLNGIEIAAVPMAELAAPTALQAMVDQGGIALTWDASSASQVTYNVYRKAEGDPAFTELEAGLATPAYHDGAVVQGVAYTYYVIVISEGTESPASDQVTSMVPEDGGSGTPPEVLPDALPYHFDFGKGQVAAGYIGVSESAIYSEALGYGFASTTGLGWGQSTDSDPLLADYAIPGEQTVFLVDLPAGDYEVSITSGQAGTATQTGILAEGIQKVQIPEAPAEGYMQRSFQVALIDEQLSITFNGSDPRINALSITALPQRSKGANPTVYMTGDSTVQTYDEYWKPQAGWGQMIERYFDDSIEFNNHAIGGRSSRSFVEQGRLDDVLRLLRPDDYLMIQFGHNDATVSVPERYTSPDDFKNYLGLYVNGARQRGAEPILVTPVGRRSYDAGAGKFNVSFPEYVAAMKEVATNQNVPLIDLSSLSVALYDQMGFEATQAVFLYTDPGVYSAFPTGKMDDTHFQEYGAIQIARLIAGAIGASTDNRLATLGQALKEIEAPQAPPAAPSGLVAGSISSAGATLSWSETAGADVYKVYRKLATEAASAYTLIGSATMPLLHMIGMEEGTAYHVVVTAMNERGESEQSQPLTITTKQAAYKFDFQGGTGNNPGVAADGYSVVELGSNEQRSTVYNPQRGYGMIYDAGHITRDRGAGGHQDLSPVMQNLLRDWIGHFNSGWEFRVDVPNGIYSAKIYVGDFGGSARTNVTINGVGYGAANAARNNYTERVINNVLVKDGKLLFHFGGSTGIANGLEITAVLVSPTGMQLTSRSLDLNNPQIKMDWEAAEGIVEYRVYRQVEGAEARVQIGNTTTSSWTDNDVTVGMTYRYSVAAVDASGLESLRSEELMVPLMDAENTTTLQPPANLRVVETEKNQVTLGWNAVAGAHAYAVYRSEKQDGSYMLVGVSGTTSYSDTDVLTTIPYYYQVRALHSGQPSELSASVQSEAVTTLVRQMEALNRAPVAIQAEEGVYIGWRLLGTDPENIAFHLYRDGVKITNQPLTSSTNYMDTAGTLTSEYGIAAVIDGQEQPVYETAAVWSEAYLDIPLNKPEGGVTPLGEPYDYSANDASVADLDGDGEYEIIVKWNPSNAKDNSHAGYTGNVYLDAYKLSGEQLWRIDLGRNIRAGAHYTQFIAYDLDGDGKAEIAMKTADGTVDGQGKTIGQKGKDYRNSSGYVLSGAEYLTVFDGLTGAELATVPYDPPRGVVDDWGDGYGNRVDRLMAGVAYLDGERPSLIMSRGIYTRSVIAAYNWRDGELTQLWRFDTLDEGNGAYASQGYHSLSIADVDNDGKDEIVYGQMVVDDNGKGLYSTGLGHGDALHVGNFVPSRPGLEVFATQENIESPYGYDLRDAQTGEILWGVFTGEDTGRGLIADIDPRYEGAEAWAVKGEWNSRIGGLHSAKTGEKISDSIPSTNFAIWWDGDLLRELLDHDFDSNLGAGTGVIDKWDYENNRMVRLLTAEGTFSSNHTKGNPALQADILGDWREEAVWRTEDSTALRIYTTTDVTEHRLFTLMHDPTYRLAIAWQNVGYNQPPHPGFFLGHGMEMPPPPSIYVNHIAVSDITAGAKAEVMQVGESQQLTAQVAPAAASNKQLVWSVAELDGAATSKASIDNNGLLVAQQAGTVRVTARAADGSQVSDTLTVRMEGGGTYYPPVITQPVGAGGGNDKTQPIRLTAEAGNGAEAVAKPSASVLRQAMANSQPIAVSLPQAGEYSSLRVILPPEAAELAAAAKASGVRVHTPLGNLLIDAALLAADQQQGQSAALALVLAREAVPAAAKAGAGKGTVATAGADTGADVTSALRLTAYRGDKPVQALAGSLTIELPPQGQGAGLHSEQWVVLRQEADSSLQPIKNSRLNQEGRLVFTVEDSGLFVPAYQVVSFTDWQAGKLPWAEKAMRSLAARDIIRGYGDGSFRPEKQVTRAEFLQLLLGAYDMPQSSLEHSFTDVPAGSWYEATAAAGQQLGIVMGKSSGHFAANETITREELAVMAYRLALQKKLPLTSTSANQSSFADSGELSAYAQEAINALYANGLLQGVSGNRFAPKQGASRAEAATIIYRMMQADN